ncbi:hypothetical protein BEN78_03735 [Xanthomonas citri pv. mangiferaeindicae]|nr:hypothetical protein BEN78_03735 [Xanthomonas citri pv. mangiferaeindicae]
MKQRAFSRRVRFWFWAAVFFGYSVAVAGVVVDAIGDHYGGLAEVAETTIAAPPEQRRLGAAQVAALYRAQSPTPFRTLPPGATFRVVWPDGSSELVRIVSQSSEHGTQLVEGSQVGASGLPSTQTEVQVVPVSTATPARRAPGANAHVD